MGRNDLPLSIHKPPQNHCAALRSAWDTALEFWTSLMNAHLGKHPCSSLQSLRGTMSWSSYPFLGKLLAIGCCNDRFSSPDNIPFRIVRYGYVVRCKILDSCWSFETERLDTRNGSEANRVAQIGYVCLRACLKFRSLFTIKAYSLQVNWW